MNRTLRWLIGSGVFVTSTLLVWSSFGAAFQAPRYVEMLRLLPPDAEGVVFIDVRALEEAGFLQGTFSSLLNDQAAGQIPGEFEEFIEKTGFDPVRDINRLMIGISPDRGVLAVADADFDPDRFAAFFRESGFETTNVGTYSLVVPDPERDWSFSLVDDTVLFGARDVVTEGLSRVEGSGSSAAESAALSAAIAELDVDSSQVWGTGVLGDMPAMNGFEGVAPPMALDLIAALERVTYQMGVGAVVRAHLHGEFSGADTALRAGDLLRGFVALGKMGSREQPDLAELLNGFEVVNVENNVDVRFTASRELIDRLSNSALAELPEVE